MRKLLLLLLTACAVAQNPNPQTNWPAQMSYAGPDSWLTFNQLSVPYLDSVTGSTWTTSTPVTVGSLPASCSGTTAANKLYFNSAMTANNPQTVTSISFMTSTTISAGQTMDIVYGTNVSNVYTPAGIISVTLNASTGSNQTETLTAPTNFTAFTLPGAVNLASYFASGGGPCTGTLTGSGYGYATSSGAPSVGVGQATVSAGGTTLALTLSGTVSAIGTLTTGQPGFDAGNSQQYSVEIPYNGWLAAPNNTVGDLEWTSPWSLVYQLDNLNYSGTGTKYLETKGQLGSNANRWWKLYLAPGSSGGPQLCFAMNGTNAGDTYSSQIDLCTVNVAANLNQLPNGYNYTVVVSWAGVGSPSDLSLYLNGQPQVTTVAPINYYPGYVTVAGSGGTGYNASVPVTNTSGTGAPSTGFYLGTMTTSGGAFSSITATAGNNYGWTTAPTLQVAPYYLVVTSGTGYASGGTGFTSTGGGCPNGSIAGTIAGATLAGAITYTSDSSLCTSAPTMSLVNPTGTGATLTATASPGSGVTLTATTTGITFSTATTNPTIVAGANVSGVFQGFSTTSSDAPMYVDETALFNTQLSEVQGQSLFYQTKFYQLPLYTGLQRLKIINDNDHGDPDNLAERQFLIALHKAGIVEILADIMEDGAPCAFGLDRQLYDQAGLGNIPVARPSTFAVTSSCSTAAYTNLSTFNASTDLTVSDYPTAASVYCAAMAANPSTPIYIVDTGGARGLADFMQSAAGTCTPTQSGLQLLMQDAANGGEIFLQGMPVPNLTGGCTSPCSFSGDNMQIDWQAGQYVLANNCYSGTCIPMIWTGGTPQQSGPGPLYTLTAKSPAWLFYKNINGGLDTRQAYDSLSLAQFFSPLFTGGVQIAISGSGTGYANSTTYNLTGCPNGVGQFVMVSSGGVPASITYPVYQTSGVGYGFNGCTPTAVQVGSTGSGAVLTVTSTQQCGYSVVTSATAGTVSTATCASHQQYFQYTGNNSSLGGAPPLLTWFLSSLIDRPPQGQVRISQISVEDLKNAMYAVKMPPIQFGVKWPALTDPGYRGYEEDEVVVKADARGIGAVTLPVLKKGVPQ